jgi:hypothetical protein
LLFNQPMSRHDRDAKPGDVRLIGRWSIEKIRVNADLKSANVSLRFRIPWGMPGAPFLHLDAIDNARLASLPY